MLGELLIAAGAIERDQLEVALAEQKNWGGALGAALVRMGMVGEQTLVRALAAQLNLPVMKLAGKRVNSEILEVIPVALADKHHCLPLLVNGQGSGRVLYLGMGDPSDAPVVAEISARIGMKIQPVLVAPTELEDGIRRHYHGSGEDEGFFEVPSERSDSTEPSEPTPDDDMGPLEFADDSALPPEPRVSASPPSASNDAMMRAIAQLLVEKGVFTREELVQRLKTAAIPKRDA